MFRLEPEEFKTAPQSLRKKTICLNMIVKDEKDVIRRSLASVKNLIDYWVIVDTGSSDGTQAIIKEFMKDIPGELHERPWVNFAHNRNEAMTLAKDKGDYLLFIDADEQLVYADNFRRPNLDKDYYYIKVRQGGIDCLRVFLIESRLPWKWKGVLHEELVCDEAKSCEALLDVVDMATANDGNRSRDPEKHIKDAKVLEKAMIDEPTNSRYAIFLGQTYVCAKEYKKAMKAFEKRVSMGGRAEEVFWSLYSIGQLQETLKMSQDQIVDSYCKAYQYRPSRIEPLFSLAYYYYTKKNFVLAYAVAKMMQSAPIPLDIVYVIHSVYQYKRQFLLANCAFELGKYDEAASLYEQILQTRDLPDDVRREIQANLCMTKSRLIQ